MEKIFKEKDLIEFGNYILSEERKNNLLKDTDIFEESWLSKLENKIKQVNEIDLQIYLNKKSHL